MLNSLIATPVMSTCRGVYFRGHSQTFTRAGGTQIEQRQGLRLLKRMSCPGCDECGWVVETMSSAVADGYFLFPDEGIKHGAVYQVKIINEWRNYGPDGCDDHYDVTVEEVTL